MPFSFINLPGDIWCGKVVAFLELSELVRVDTAIVKNGDNRTAYHQNIRGSILNQLIVLGPGPFERIEWLIRNKISPNAVLFKTDFEFDQLTSISGIIAQTTDIRIIKSTISDEHFEQIMQCCAHHIKSLWLDRCNNLTSDVLLRWIANCPSLTACRLFGCKGFTGSTFAAIPVLRPNMLHFSVGRFPMADIRKGFAHFQRLVSFECHSTLNGPDLALIASSMPNLESLKLSSGTHHRFPAFFPALFRTCTKIRCLDLTGFQNLADGDVEHAAKELPLLRELTLAATPQLTYNGVVAVANSCTHLSVLDVSYCKQIQNDAIIMIGSKCRHLTSLSVASCALLTDLAFRTLNPTTCEYINVSSTDVNGSFLKYLLVRGTVLRSVNVNKCKHVFEQLVDSITVENNIRSFQAGHTKLTKVMWMKLSRQLPHLRTIDAAHCAGVNDEVALEIILHHPFLKYFAVQNSNVSKDMLELYRCLHFENDEDGYIV